MTPDRGAVASLVGPLLGVRVALSRGPWRIGPGWAVLAGALASSAPLFDGPVLLRLTGALLLADAAWGVVWAVTSGAPHADSAPGGLARLPYAQPDAPAARLWQGLRSMTSGGTWHEFVAGMAFSLGLGALLGLGAVALSALTLAVVVVAWLIRSRGLHPALPNALLNVGLPWVLGAWAVAGRDAAPTGLALGAAFTALQWGIQRPALGVWLGQALVLATLAALRQPPALALAAICFLPPAQRLVRAGENIAQSGGLRSWRVERQSSGEPAPLFRALPNRADFSVDAALADSGPWWLAAMLLAAGLLSRYFV